MSNTSQVDKNMFDESGHYLGKPADFTDKIIRRRLTLTCRIENFVGKDLDLVDIGCGNGATIILLESCALFLLIAPLYSRALRQC